MSAEMMKKIHPKKKLALVQEALKENNINLVADKHGITKSRLESWVDLFMKAGKKELKWTKEPVEFPKLHIIQQSQNFKFPTQILRHVETAAFFFSALTFGRNDAIYAYTAGVPHVLCNDIDERRLKHMQKIYPSHWEYHPGDAFHIAKQIGENKRQFDLVMCDVSGSLCAKIFNEFHLWRTLVKKYFVSYASVRGEKNLLLPKGIDLEHETIDMTLLKQFDPTIKKVSLYKRSMHNGGSFSMLFEFE